MQDKQRPPDVCDALLLALLVKVVKQLPADTERMAAQTGNRFARALNLSNRDCKPLLHMGSVVRLADCRDRDTIGSIPRCGKYGGPSQAVSDQEPRCLVGAAQIVCRSNGLGDI